MSVATFRIMYSPRGFLSACYVSSGGSKFGRLSLYRRTMSNRDIPLKFSMARVFGIYTTTAIVNSQTEVSVPVTSSTSYKSVLRS